MLKIYSLFALVWLVHAYYNESPCAQIHGKCMPSSKCPAHSQKKGFCPQQSSSIKCCVPYSESRCNVLKGRCQWKDETCEGNFYSGRCPTQHAHIKCCVKPSPAANCQNKYKNALKEIFRYEGQCQNFKNDKGNWYKDRLGYTCMGITPAVGWNNKQLFSACLPYRGHAASFVIYCYEKNKSQFKQAASKIYMKKYMEVCAHLPDPAFFVCSDISVNSGPGRVLKFMKILGRPRGNIKIYARKLNNMHREFYKLITERNKKYEKFLAGWLRRADKRDEYINSYDC